MRSNNDLLRMVDSWNDDPRGSSENAVAKREYTLAKLRERAEAIRSGTKPTKVKVIHNLSNNTIERIEIVDE